MKSMIIRLFFIFKLFFLGSTTSSKNVTVSDIELAIMTCDNATPNEEADCTSLSTKYVNCCFLTTNANHQKVATSVNIYVRKHCLPVRPSTTDYRKYMMIFGLNYKMFCGEPVKNLPLDIYEESFERFEPCGTHVADDVSQCRKFSLKNNSCCAGTYKVFNLSIEEKVCFYLGSKYDEEKRKSKNFKLLNIGKTSLEC